MNQQIKPFSSQNTKSNQLINFINATLFEYKLVTGYGVVSPFETIILNAIMIITLSLIGTVLFSIVQIATSFLPTVGYIDLLDGIRKYINTEEFKMNNEFWAKNNKLI